MVTVTLGSTQITVNKMAFGALPIQRISKEEAKKLLIKAYKAGITFLIPHDFIRTVRKKIGYALNDVRDKIYIATKQPLKMQRRSGKIF